MSSSTAFDCSLMVHLKGAGWLNQIYEHLKPLQPEPDMAHQIRPVLYSTSGSINNPFWSTTLDMLKVESTSMTVRPISEITMWLLGISWSITLVPQEVGNEGTWPTFDQTQMPSMQDLKCLDPAGHSSGIIWAWKMMDQDSWLHYWALPCIEKADLAISNYTKLQKKHISLQDIWDYNSSFWDEVTFVDVIIQGSMRHTCIENIPWGFASWSYVFCPYLVL